MSQWPSTKARLVPAALLRIGWMSSVNLAHHTVSYHVWGGPNFTFAFHDQEEIGPRMLARIAKRTGLTPGDL